jgi:predicted anti-sigma-YlaC factor YlaD
MVGSKECFKCKAVKPLKEFYKHQQMADGHLNKCKDCAKRDVSAHRENNLERVRQYDRERARDKARVKAAAEVTRLWRAADRRRGSAHSAVSRAIRSGALVRGPCVMCGDAKSVGHHEDYDKPLEVVWLCQACHVRHHQLKQRL